MTLLGGVGDRAGGFLLTTREEAGAAGEGYLSTVRIMVTEDEES